MNKFNPTNAIKTEMKYNNSLKRNLRNLSKFQFLRGAAYYHILYIEEISVRFTLMMKMKNK